MKQVYVVNRGEGAFKVGISAFPYKRLNALQTAHDVPLRLTTCFDTRPSNRQIFFHFVLDVIQLCCMLIPSKQGDYR